MISVFVFKYLLLAASGLNCNTWDLLAACVVVARDLVAPRHVGP